MTCSPERISGYVDDALEAAERVELEAHLAGCAACRAQAAAERSLRERLRGLPAPEPPGDLEWRLRRVLKHERRSWARRLLPLAAGLALFVFWVRGFAPFVAWELALDHAKCFRNDRLPAKVFSEDPERVAAWFEERGTRLPVFPAQAGGLMLVGGRYCPLADGSFAAHIYYASEGDGHASLFVLSHGVRLNGAVTRKTLGRSVHLAQGEGQVVALVSEQRAHVDALRRALTTTLARAARY